MASSCVVWLFRMGGWVDGRTGPDLQGSKDVCVLNFCVFLFWDYVPTVWLLLVMEGTTGEHVGASVVKVCPPPPPPHARMHATPHGAPSSN